MLSLIDIISYLLNSFIFVFFLGEFRFFLVVYLYCLVVIFREERIFFFVIGNELYFIYFIYVFLYFLIFIDLSMECDVIWVKEI